MPNTYQRSVWMIILGGACLSLLGIGVRLMEQASGEQVVFYRAASQFVFIAGFMFLKNPRQSVKQYFPTSWHGYLASSFLAVASLAIVFAIHYTSVANVYFIGSLTPLTSAILGWLILKETTGRKTWIAIAVAILGISIIFSKGLDPRGVLGIGLAFVMVVGYSATLITIRSKPGSDVFSITALAALFLMLAIAPFIDDFSISKRDLILCIFLGIFQVGFGLLLVTYGAKNVPTAQVSLLALLEIVLSPIWVWLGVGETPNVYTLVGGAVILIGICIQIVGKTETSTSPHSQKT